MPPPRRVGRLDVAVGKPELVNPLNLQGNNREKVYGLTVKSQEIPGLVRDKTDGVPRRVKISRRAADYSSFDSGCANHCSMVGCSSPSGR